MLIIIIHFVHGVRGSKFRPLLLGAGDSRGAGKDVVWDQRFRGRDCRRASGRGGEQRSHPILTGPIF